MALLEVKNVKKIYTTRFGGNQVQALADVNFSVEPREYVAIMGESGSGKTTLLNILAALDKPTGGKVLLKGRDLTTIKEREMAAFRRQNLGFVFQDFNLLDTFSLRDNIFLPLVLAGKKYPEMESRLRPIVEQLGITHLLNKYPYEVSGGQKQRAAVARALITKPQLILADEPTGALYRSCSCMVRLSINFDRVVNHSKNASNNTNVISSGLDVYKRQVPVGKQTLGRMFNVLGEAIDKGEPVESEEKWAIHREPPKFCLLYTSSRM